MTTTRGRRPRQRKGLFMTWAGDSVGRRLVAWFGQTAILIAMAAAVFAVVWFVLVPMMTGGVVEVFRNSTR